VSREFDTFTSPFFNSIATLSPTSSTGEEPHGSRRSFSLFPPVVHASLQNCCLLHQSNRTTRTRRKHNHRCKLFSCAAPAPAPVAACVIASYPTYLTTSSSKSIHPICDTSQICGSTYTSYHTAVSLRAAVFQLSKTFTERFPAIAHILW